MDCALTCILVIVVSMFTAPSREFTQKYLYSSNNLITDFTNLSNRIFLYVYKITTVALQLPHGVKINISGFGGLEVACWPLVPKFAGSNPAEAVGFFRAKKSSAHLPSEGK